ncbi:MAG: hypothetical protein HN742_11870 [Lentisphaerae bacterium]|jgi:hypothetical protein|nr:hypothetical protein [Lentisphaerota bacterium]MBT4816140.1 hypothetical protein [Lentisphaerota bacterium]MBT5605415.1 hypothetical protein [Lentisphaerota bacterium]MBT7061971.1 hypothetical protein [Lentisphaerota bacterium]MBT7842566.1 hypothetical protein [Lentisphaerota bacterium]
MLATDLGSRLELFVDDHAVERIEGDALLRLHQPIPRERVLTHDAPWEGTGSGYHTVIYDGDLYRLYYRGWHLEVDGASLRSNRHPPYACLALSTDGIHWEKPELGIVDFRGPTANNIILEGVGMHNFAPFLDVNPNCAGDARFKALAGTKAEGGLFLFASPDGVHWSMVAEDPVITDGAFDSQNVAFWDSELGKYRAYWRFFTGGGTSGKVWAPKGVRAIRTAVSDDLFHWTDQEDLTYVDSPADEHLYTNQVFSYNRAPHIQIGFPTRYVDRGWSEVMRALPDCENREVRAVPEERLGTAITEGLLMAGRDGVTFKRWNEAFLRPGPERPGTWSYGHQYIACNVVETASSLPGAPPELSLYAGEDYWIGSGSAVRRYSLRLDGFVSVSAPMSGGSLLTKPVTFEGRCLELNLATSAAGSVRVELQRPDGTAIDGFALSDCQDVFGDAIARKVTWTGGEDVSALQGEPVRLCFELRDADLYAFRFCGT